MSAAVMDTEQTNCSNMSEPSKATTMKRNEMGRPVAQKVADGYFRKKLKLRGPCSGSNPFWNLPLLDLSSSEFEYCTHKLVMGVNKDG